MQNQQFLSLLKLIRDDLRQTIDTGSSTGVKVPATPREWIAPLRHRFMQLCDDLDIETSWSLPMQWQAPPNALQCLALTRLVEEAMINIVKHSRARQVQVRMWQTDTEDDGVGFDVDAVHRAGISIGMRILPLSVASWMCNPHPVAPCLSSHYNSHRSRPEHCFSSSADSALFLAKILPNTKLQ